MSMKAIDKTVIRIRAEDARAAALWTLPIVQSKHVVALQEKPVAVVQETEEELLGDEYPGAKLTLAELEKIREDAYQEGLQQGRDEGLQQGLEEGRVAGHKEGLEKAQLEIDQKAQLLSELQQQLDFPLKQLDADVERLIVDMVLELSQALLSVELQERTGVVTKAVEEAVALLPQTSGEIKILANSADLATLEPLLKLNERWSLVEDNAIAQGGCKVTSGYGLIDNTVERRFAAAADQLKQALAQSSHDSDDHD